MTEEKKSKKPGQEGLSRLDPVEGEEGVEEARMRLKWELLKELKGRKIVDAQAGFWLSKNTGEEIMLLLDDDSVLYLSTVQLDKDGEPVDEVHEKGVYMGLEAMREERALIWDAEAIAVESAGDESCADDVDSDGDDDQDDDDDEDGDDGCGCGHTH